MEAVKLAYLIPIALIASLLWWLMVKRVKNFDVWVQEHWLYQVKSKVKLGKLIQWFALLLLLLALLDFKGEPEKVEAKIQRVKTLVMLDVSSSMLAEDIRPNRFQKSIMLARHYLKKAAGQEISLVLFSDRSLKLVPFTQDTNLIEARLGTVEDGQLQGGGTSLSQALMESVNYFRDTDGKVEDGNILLITDAEDHEPIEGMDFPKNLKVAVLAVGTAQGAPIPIKNSQGIRVRNKSFNGEEVITKVDELTLKRFQREINKYRYWIVNTYSLPTEEILSFFREINTKSDESSDTIIRPVLAHYLMIPGMILFIVSLLMNFGKSFVPLGLLILVNFTFAQQVKNIPMPEKPALAPGEQKILDVLEERFKKGKATESEKGKLAELYFKNQNFQRAEQIYNEMTEKDTTDEFNHASSKFASKDILGGINKSSEVLKKLEKDNSPEAQQLKQKLRQNILKALASQAGQAQSSESEEQEDSDQSENDQQQDSQQNQQKGEQEENQENSQNNQQQNSSEQNDQNNQEKNQDQNKDKEEEKDSEGSDQDQETQDEKEGEEDKEKEKESQGNQQDKDELEQQERAQLEQLLSEDNKLQKEMIDAQTKTRNRDKRDW